MRIHSFAGSALALLMVATPLAAQETYSLDFAWPTGAADVTVETSISASVMGQPQTLDMEMGYRMDVSKDGDAIRISYSDYMMDGVAMEALAESGSPDEMTRLFRDTPEAIHNSMELGRRLQFTLQDLGYRFPRYPLSDGETATSYLRQITLQGAAERYHDPNYRRRPRGPNSCRRFR